MSAICPDGHPSTSTDYCDVCGLPIGSTPAAAPGASAAAGAAGPPIGSVGSVLTLAGPATERECPHCGATQSADALFCEDCGYDFTTGALPESLPPVPLGPPDHAGTSAPDDPPPVPLEPPDQAGTAAPDVPLAAVPTVEWVAEVWVDPDWYQTQDSTEPCPSAGTPVVVRLAATSLLVGRRSVSRNIHPQVDCGADSGVSRRHAQLTTDGQRWWVEDLQSANGTYLGAPAQPLPTIAIEPGRRTEFALTDRLYLGAWTRIVIRRATPDEQ